MAMRMGIKISSSRKYTKFIQIFSQKKKSELFLLVIAQCFNSILDLIGIFFSGIVALLITSHLTNTDLPEKIINLTELLNVGNYSLEYQVSFFSLIMVFFFISKSLISLYLSYYILKFHSQIKLDFTQNIFTNLLNSEYSWLKRQKLEEVYDVVGPGIHSVVFGVIANLLVIISESFLLLVIFIFLIFYNPYISLFTFVFFSAILIILEKIIGKHAIKHGRSYTENSVLQHSSLNIALLGFKEISILGKKNYFNDRFFSASRISTASIAKSLWLQTVPKYVIEVALTLGLFLLSFYVLSTNVNNISILVVFIVAAGRITPTLFRIQSSFYGLKNKFAHAEKTLDLATSLIAKAPSQHHKLREILNSPPVIKIDCVSFNYPDDSEQTIDKLSCEIASGEITAFVGESGAGKTTLIDLILNIYSPNAGKITIQDGDKEVSPGIASNIAYVPQKPLIFNGTILENIAFASNLQDIDLDSLRFAIDVADLNKVIENATDGINTQIGNIGSLLSGGEQQRLVLARALYQSPKLLIIDEGTNSLDFTTENLITKNLGALREKITIIIVTHRISSLKKVDNIFYLENGKIIGSGNYSSLQNQVREFEKWVKSLAASEN
jgi:ATP-binding cassette subfamily C protein